MMSPAARRLALAALLLALIACPLPPAVAQEGPTATPAPLAGPLLAGDGPDNAYLFLLNPVTGARRDLVFTRGRQWFGDFSPDGCRIVYTLADPADGRTRIYTAGIDGSDPRELFTFADTSGALYWEAWSPRWSPAGDRIAFMLVRYAWNDEGEIERQSHIAWVPAEGGTPTFYSVSGGESQLMWSPDGSELAYVSFAERTSDGTSTGVVIREADVWVVSADGLSKRQLTDFPTGNALYPRWSRDGQQIAFVYAPSGNNHQFYVMPAAGGIPRQLTVTWALALAFDWLPDGSGLIAAVRDFRGVADNVLWRVPLTGDADNTATLYVDDPRVTASDFPAFSADGAWLAFRSAYGVMVYEPASGALLDLPELGLNNTGLAWSPAGFAGEAACAR